jgi:hypothetical protein
MIGLVTGQVEDNTPLRCENERVFQRLPDQNTLNQEEPAPQAG